MELSEISFQRVKVNPGETLVFRVPASAHSLAVGDLHDKVKALFPNNPILVLCGEVEIFAIETPKPE